MAIIKEYELYLNDKNYSLYYKDQRGNIKPYNVFFKQLPLKNYSRNNCMDALSTTRPADLTINPFYRNNKVQGGLPYEESWKWVEFNKIAYGWNTSNPNWKNVAKNNQNAYDTFYNFWYTNALSLDGFDELRITDLGQWLANNRTQLANLNLEAIADEKVGEAIFSFVDAGYYALITPYTVRFLGALWRGANVFKMDFGDGVVESYVLKYIGR